MSEKKVFTDVPEPKKKPGILKKRKKKHIIFRMIGFLFRTIGTIILIALSTGALLACFGAVYIKTVIMPQSSLDLSNFFVGENSVMYYTDPYTGQDIEMVTLLNTTSSIWKDYHELPIELIQATVAIEDKRFWEHPGVDWRRTGAAVVYMFTGQDIQGGSTITQQLIKNLTTYDDVTVKRKVIEIFRAFDLDANYSKEDIITWYLNIIYLGEGAKGVGAASWEYFGKDVSELSLAECASLISITNNPSSYNPYGTWISISENEETGEITEMDGRARNKYRQELVLYELYDQGTIDATTYISAKNEVLNFVRSADDEAPATVYTWFEEQVIDDVRDDLIAEYGYSYEAANMMLASGGLSIYTTINQEVQAVADAVYQDWDSMNVPSSNGQKLQSAITIIDNSSGDVVAMVGQMGIKERNLLMNYATESSRQPGSAIKPLSVYAPALELGLIGPTAVLDDYPYMLINNSVWPGNAYGYYRGMSNLDFAIQQSSNCIAARIVGDYLTPEVSFDYMTNTLHFDLVELEESYGRVVSDVAIAPLALGGLTHGVNTRDMAEAYASFPNGGTYTHSRTYTKVVNSKGEVVLENTPQQEYAMAYTTAYYINDLLQGVMTSAGTGSKANFNGMTLAGKTGTTNDKYDLWFVGYSPYYTAAVWTGYEYNEEINRTSEPAMTMWKKVMEPLHTYLDDNGFYTPDGLVSVSYCLDSGLTPNSYCSRDSRGSRVATKMVYPQNAPVATCTAHGSGSSVTLCTASLITDEDGNSTGSYKLAGQYCPSSTKSTRSYVIINRTLFSGASARDSGYTYSGGFYGTCTVHTSSWSPSDPVTPQVDTTVPDTGENDASTTPPTTDNSGGSDNTGSTGNTGNTGNNDSGGEDTSGGIPGVTDPVVPSEPSTPEPEPSTPDPTPEPTPEPTPTPDPTPEPTPTPDTTPSDPSTAIPGVG